eukprot:6187220-Pleurochrysis_carterae.AAC.2
MRPFQTLSDACTRRISAARAMLDACVIPRERTAIRSSREGSDGSPIACRCEIRRHSLNPWVSILYVAHAVHMGVC